MVQLGLRAGDRACHRGELAAGAVDEAAHLLLRGIDPHRHLTTTDVVEVALTRRALQRTVDLRAEELDAQAVLIIQRLAEALEKS
ncbi:hypothetical protein [Patulibacter sp. SYSU D01012]|uniref:hypothetical protein n=1 Tax=Patulibacter sp. SYSU D01012 TaxID=2817381 RepID=UPI001B30AB4E|nr:hypothetical protein [Patulibacter sp. SYSU D01012]